MAKKNKNKLYIESSPTSDMWKLLSLFVLVVFLYFPSLDNPLLYDSEFIQKNQFYNHMWHGFNLLSTRWVTYVSFALFGKNLVLHRSVNVLVHLVNIFLIYKILRLLFIKLQDGRMADAHLAFWGAALFAVSPMAVFGVVYLVQRLILLSTMLMLVSLFGFIKAICTSKKRWYVLSVLFFFLSVHAKEHSALMPIVLLVLLVVFKKMNKEYFLANWHWLLVYILVSIQIFMVTSPELTAVYEPHAKMVLATQSQSAPGSLYVLSVINQGYAFFKYLLLWLIPIPIWMAFDLQFPLPSQILSWPHLIAFFCFWLYVLTAVTLLFKKGQKSLLGLGLVCPAILFLTEFVVTRYTENFVISEPRRVQRLKTKGKIANNKLIHK